MSTALVRLLLPATVFLVLCSCSSKRPDTPQTSAKAPARLTNLAVTRSVSLPVRVVPDPSKAETDPATLTITEPGDDEPSEGPSTFDVRPDHGFVVADPLRQRVVFYDAAGKYEQDLLLYMAPQHLRVLPNNALSIVRFHTSERYIYDTDAAGQYKAPRLAAPSDPDPDIEDAGEVKLDGPQSATVRALAAPGKEAAPLAVSLDGRAERLVSVRRLGEDPPSHTYVLLESAAPSDTVEVRMSVRKYTRGKVAGEIADVSSDYFMEPEDAFRVRDGLVYQLVPTSAAVRINIWDTSSIR